MKLPSVASWEVKFQFFTLIKTRDDDNGSFLSHCARGKRKTFTILNYRKFQFKIICCYSAMNILGGCERNGKVSSSESTSKRKRKTRRRQFILIDCQFNAKFKNDKTFPEAKASDDDEELMKFQSVLRCALAFSRQLWMEKEFWVGKKRVEHERRAKLTRGFNRRSFFLRQHTHSACRRGLRSSKGITIFQS